MGQVGGTIDPDITTWFKSTSCCLDRKYRNCQMACTNAQAGLDATECENYYGSADIVAQAKLKYPLDFYKRALVGCQAYLDEMHWLKKWIQKLFLKKYFFGRSYFVFS